MGTRLSPVSERGMKTDEERVEVDVRGNVALCDGTLCCLSRMKEVDEL